LKVLKPHLLTCRYFQAFRPEVLGAGWMTPFERPDHCCPKCEHKGYMFLARNNIEVPEGKFV
jgi:hypothetical protein